MIAEDNVSTEDVIVRVPPPMYYRELPIPIEIARTISAAPTLIDAGAISAAHVLTIGVEEASIRAYEAEYIRQCELVISMLNRAIEAAKHKSQVTLNLSTRNISVTSSIYVSASRSKETLIRIVNYIRTAYADYTITTTPYTITQSPYFNSEIDVILNW